MHLQKCIVHLRAESCPYPSLSIHLVAAPGAAITARDQFLGLANEDVIGGHTLTTDPESADAIVFTDAHLLPHDVGLRAFRDHPLARRHWEKCFVYDERDRPWLALPGVHVSMPAAHVDRAWQRAWTYYKAPTAARPTGPDAPPELLFSFVGSLSHPVRHQLVRIEHPRGLIEAVDDFTFYDPSSPNYESRRTHYVESLRRSKFVICPRGKGTSSIRMLETLAAGRVPVVISDDWVAPTGPNWSAFSLRLAQRELSSLPQLVEASEERWSFMAAAAATAYDEWFSQKVAFHRLGDLLADILVSLDRQPFPQTGVRNGAWRAAHLDHLSWCSRAHLRKLVSRS